MLDNIKKFFLLSLLSLCIVTSILSAPIYIDTTFGNNGFSNIPKLNSNYLNQIAIQNDQKIIVTGNEKKVAFLTRLNTDGSIDTSFGTAGIVYIDQYDLFIKSVTVDASNNIFVAGSALINNSNNAFIAKYDTNGDLVAGFGTGGIALPTIGMGAIANSIILQTDDKIVITGSIFDGSISTPFVARLLTDGSLDTTFNTTGYNNIPYDVLSGANSIAIQTISGDDKLTITGVVLDSILRVFVARFNSDGTIDTTFGINGIVEPSIGSNSIGNAIKIDVNNNILICGSTRIANVNYLFLARFDTAGNLDNTFGTSGVVTQTLNDGLFAIDLVIQVDENIVVAGYSELQSGRASFVARFTNIGSLDTTLGDGGKILFSSDASERRSSVKIQADGKIVYGGTISNDSTIARFNANNTSFVLPTTPADGSTINTNTTPISGISSESNAYVKVSVNGTVLVTVPTDSNGKWDAGVSKLLVNGTNSITADLMISPPTLIATNTINFTVSAPDAIVIYNPADGSQVATSVVNVSGIASLASGQVELQLDGTTFATATADAFGVWSNASPTLTLGTHSITASLLTTAATTTNNFTTIVGAKIVQGNVPCDQTIGTITTGPGYSATQVSASEVNIEFTPAFSNSPTVIATGQRASGDSTVTVVSGGAIDPSNVSLTFTSGTSFLNFAAFSYQ